MLKIEALLLDLLQHRAVLPEFARDASYAERDQLLLRRPLGVLNSALNGRDYLTDSNFTVADLNVASILAWSKMGRLDLSSHSNLARWLDSCLARPPTAECAIGQGASECPSRFRHRADGYLT